MKNISDKLRKTSISKRFRNFYVVVLSCFITCNVTLASGANQPTNQKLIFLNMERLQLAKQMIEAQDTLYTNAYNSIIAFANKELKRIIDPVTNKTVIPASGDIHDYHTLGSYYWPDSSKADGLP